MDGTTLRFSMAYHPQTTEQIEVINQIVESYLMCSINGYPKQWMKWLAWAEFWFSPSYNASIDMSPFHALYGREPPTVIKYLQEGTAVQEIDQLLKERDAILEELKMKLSKAQNSMKIQADKKRRDVELTVGEMVYLKAQPYKWKSLAHRPNEKLSPRFYGPFAVEERVGKVAYKLKLLDHARIHPAITATVPCQQLPQFFYSRMGIASTAQGSARNKENGEWRKPSASHMGQLTKS
ncbi:Tf2-8, partial [Mucuna pruriens]